MFVHILVVIYLTKLVVYCRFVNDSHNFKDSRYISKNNNLITVDIKHHESTRKIKYEYDRRTDSHTFTPRSPYLVKVVTKGNQIIWNSADHDYEYGIQVFVGYDEQGKRMFRVYFQGDFTPRLPHTFVHHPHPHSQSFHKHSSDYSRGDLILLNLKNRHNTRTVHYEFNSRKNIHTFTALPPNLFGLVLKGNKTVWQGDGLEYPDIVVLFPQDGGGYVMRVYFPSEADLSSHLPSHGLHWPDKAPKHAIEPDSFLEYKYTHAALVDLDIDNLHSTKSHTYTAHHKRKTFKTKHNYYFKTVKKGDEIIWSSGNTKHYATKVEMIRYNFPQMYEVNIMMKNGTTKKFVNNKNIHWTEVDMNDELPIMVSMNSEHETFSYTNTLKGKLRTLAAKPGFTISGLVEWLSPTDKPVVWKAGTESEYAFKVEVSNQQKVTVHFNNGSLKQIIKEADGSWN